MCFKELNHLMKGFMVIKIKSFCDTPTGRVPITSHHSPCNMLSVQAAPVS